MLGILALLLGLLLFLFSLDLMGQSFKSLSQDTIQSFIQASANPFIGLFIGLLITALIQSSSTSTAIIITAVASGSITFQDSVPMILGANVGTTLTSTLICLGYIDQKKEFRKAFATGVIHDFFNIIVVAILFPLELNYGLLSSFTTQIAGLFSDHSPAAVGDNMTYNNMFDFGLSQGFIDLVGNGLITLVISFAGLIGAVKLVSRQIYNSVIGDSQSKLRLYLFKNPFKSFGWGVVTTGIIQSSSITTSLVVPLVATGKVKLKKIAPFIYGANVGTTITAFITVAFNSTTVLNTAILHLLINLFGILLFLPFPAIRNLPVKMSKKFAAVIAKHRIGVAFYILLVFFIIPFVLINIYQNN
ncbi:Na/Pi cotransporter family protein [Fulvivirga sp. RKSG066]|nr:Na/Pi symporter [Fulvivirga aurantia]MTI21938.1 Na/Pi cotransporter family protein [Fulvivirga aurantia]